MVFVQSVALWTVSQFVIPAKSAYGGREPGSRKSFYCIDILLDSGYPPAAYSGMTGSGNYDLKSQGRGFSPKEPIASLIPPLE